MKMEGLNTWLTLIANVGVLAGIVFLAVELQQNTSMMRAQTRDSITEKTLIATAPWSNSSYAADIMWRGSNGEIASSSGPDWVTYQALVSNIFRINENEFYQHEQGLFDEAEFQGRLNIMARNMARVGFRTVWQRHRDDYSEKFREQMDLIAQNAEKR